MTKQHDLLPTQLNLKPSTEFVGPRLWVRRLVIWSELGQSPIRDISLRPGLNIIWSPDGAAENQGVAAQAPIGHGSGKTLFCRLVRYCLGEDRFANTEVRERIAEIFPEGFVGAEVMLDGTCWAVLRPLGHRRRHVATTSTGLDGIAADNSQGTGLDAFLTAIEEKIITKSTCSLIPGAQHASRGWLLALAWLARDQECRLSRVLDWRSSSSESEPAFAGLGETEKLDALRAYLRAITAEEQLSRAEAERFNREIKTLEQELGHRRWELDRHQKDLGKVLGIDGARDVGGPLASTAVRQAADDQLAKATQASTPEGNDALVKARRQVKDDQAEEALRGKALAVLEARLEELPRLISQMQGESASLSYAAFEAKSPICPICEVPLDRVLAEGCSISHKLPDLDAVREKWTRHSAQIKDEENTLAALKRQRDEERQQQAIVQQRLQRSETQLKTLEESNDRRMVTIYSARRTADEATKLETLIREEQSAQASRATAITKRDDANQLLSNLRDAQEKQLRTIRLKYDAVVKYLVDENAIGQLRVQANRLDLDIKHGGVRKTPAMDTMKILAFDLAALCVSIEGSSSLPAFLIHDSPREADLGLPVYHRLFDLARSFEVASAQPPFQYILTTTTAPPKGYEKEPWCRLMLHGSPGSERLLGVDL